jgi:hypothetical protein
MVDKFDFDAQAPLPRDRIYVSWNETWALSQYIEEYLKTRNLRRDEAARAHVFHAINRYPWSGPLRKADVDYFLDGSISKSELALPEVVSQIRKTGP